MTKRMNPSYITFADSFEIEDYAEECRTLLADVLGVDLKSSFVSDLSTLSDFRYSGIGYDADTMEWDGWVVEKIRLRFGIQAAADDLLLALCERIREHGIPGAGLN